ncbi:MAG TPA: ABC transporter transmembrane domain-containing protein, partial [Dehalococcoidia bacterium]|nr:ABC transporter transmembrane domain-containing protein [Dehalococcoidia bacterium]
MRTVLRIFAYLRYNRVAMVLAYAALAGAALFNIITPLVIKQAIDFGLAHDSRSFLVLAGVLVVAVAVVQGVFEFFQSYLGQYLSQTVALRLRDDLYEAVQRQSFAFHDRSETGQLMSRATVDVEQVRAFIQLGLLQLTYAAVLFAITVVVAVRINWPMGLLFLAVMPLIGLRAWSVSRRLRSLWVRVQGAQGDFTSVLQENLVGARVVRAFTREREELEKFNVSNRVVRVDSLEANRLAAFNQPLMTFLLNVATAIIVIVGGYEVMHHNLTLGGLVAFLEYRVNLTGPVRTIGFLLNLWTRATAGGQRIFEILDAESEVRERPGAAPLADVRGHVRFEHVSFGYNRERPVLREIEIDAPPGTLVALLGPS